MDSKATNKFILLVLALIVSACSVKFRLDGASIDYTKTKTIQIVDFPIRSSYVWGPMGPMFNNQLKDVFANHTRLIQVKRNGDLKIEVRSPSIRNAIRQFRVKVIRRRQSFRLLSTCGLPIMRITRKTSSVSSRPHLRMRQHAV